MAAFGRGPVAHVNLGGLPSGNEQREASWEVRTPDKVTLNSACSLFTGSKVPGNTEVVPERSGRLPPWDRVSAHLIGEVGGVVVDSTGLVGKVEGSVLAVVVDGAAGSVDREEPKVRPDAVALCVVV